MAARCILSFFTAILAEENTEVPPDWDASLGEDYCRISELYEDYGPDLGSRKNKGVAGSFLKSIQNKQNAFLNFIKRVFHSSSRAF